MVNRGSVGCVFRIPPGKIADIKLQPWAEYCVIDIKDVTIDFEMVKVPFDIKGFHNSINKMISPQRMVA